MIYTIFSQKTLNNYIEKEIKILSHGFINFI